MSRALQALVIIRLGARVGQWVLIDDLARHFDCAAVTVANHCERMLAERLLDARRAIDGGPIVAVRTPVAAAPRNLAPRDLTEMAQALQQGGTP